MLRGRSVSAKRISRSVLASRSTSARGVIISLTYKPAGRVSVADSACSWHSVRNGALVMPAIGASTTGGQIRAPPAAPRRRGAQGPPVASRGVASAAAMRGCSRKSGECGNGFAPLSPTRKTPFGGSGLPATIAVMTTDTGNAPDASAEPRDLAALLVRARREPRVKYVYFWGHREPREGIDANCFSQWYPSPFAVDGVTYPTAEHWMMAGKARLFGDADAERRVLTAPHPKAAKVVGRQVRGFVEQRWLDERFELIVRGNVAKF